MKTNKWLSLAFLLLIFFSSCSTDETDPTPYIPQGDFDSGVLVLNEGNFGGINASVSYISFDFNRTQNGIFSGVNPSSILGNTAQSIGFNGNLAYIVVNGSSKVEIVNRFTFQKVGEITAGLFSPRYISFANGRGYITDWGAGAGEGKVKVIDLASNSVMLSIAVADFPNRIIEHDNKLYVAHNNIGTVGNSITIIDGVSNTVGGSIPTSGLPDVMKVEGDNLWVSCNGYGSWPVPENESAGSILKFNLNTNTLILSLPQSSNTQHITFMDVFGNNIFYVVGNNVFKMPLSSTTLPSAPAFIAAADYIYGFAVNSNRVYIGDAKDFIVNGVVKVYSSGEIFDPNPTGTLLKSVEVGVAPNGFYFNQ